MNDLSESLLLPSLPNSLLFLMVDSNAKTMKTETSGLECLSLAPSSVVSRDV
jgi:hypothetical protein